MPIIEHDEFLDLTNDDYIGEVLLQADFEEKEIQTNCLDTYYDYTIPMDEFLKFADRIREKLKKQEAKK